MKDAFTMDDAHAHRADAGAASDAEPGPLRIPPLLAALIARGPQYPPSAALASLANLVLRPRVDGAVLGQLEGKVVRIVVRDAGLALTLRCRRGWLFPVGMAAPADVTIGASAYDFALLAARREDPDTLFFARRLTIEGDTETGLVVKNMLDGTDLAGLTGMVDSALARLQAARRWIGRRP